MKIVCIAASFVPSNTANSIQVVKASHALVELGHAVTLFVPGEEEMDWEELMAYYGLSQPFNIRWIPENLAFHRYDFAFKAVNAARKVDPDLVYTWVLQAGILALWRRIPVVLELHDRVTGILGPWLFRQFWRSKTPRRLLTNTNALRRVLINEFNLGKGAASIQVAPNGVELDRYQNLPEPKKARAVLNLPEKFTAGYTGHFYPGRGMEVMFELAQAQPEVNFLWVGGTQEDVSFWQSRLQSAGVKNVILTGFVNNAYLPQYQAAAEVLLMPYSTTIAGSGGGDTAEVCSPMKMFEYMAAGRAIITSDLPVFHEVLNEDLARFCPPDDLGAWNKAIVELREDPSLRKKLGIAAQRAAKAYSWQARAERALKNFV